MSSRPLVSTDQASLTAAIEPTRFTPADRPLRDPGLELLGLAEGTAYTEPRWVVALGGSRYFHLTAGLYQILQHADGATPIEEIARRVSEEIGSVLTSAQVGHLISDRLLPAGLLVGADATGAAVSRPRPPAPLLAIRHRVRLLPYRWTAPGCAILEHLFAPPLAAAVVTAAVMVNVWLYTEGGLSHAVTSLLYSPALVLALLLLDPPLRLFHELGHASAMRRAGVPHGEIGVALYVIFPVYYTDVTHAYRLDRRDRLRVDAGGIYFDLISTVALFVAYRLTGLFVLLPAMVLIGFSILREFTPLMRFDGYYIMADLVGVPDPLGMIGPLIGDRLRRRRRGGRRAADVTRRAKAVLWGYLLVMLAFMLRPLLLVGALGSAALLTQIEASGAVLWHGLLEAWRAGSALPVVVSAIQLLFWALIPLGLLLFCITLCRVAGRLLRRSLRAARRAPAAAPGADFEEPVAEPMVMAEPAGVTVSAADESDEPPEPLLMDVTWVDAAPPHDGIPLALPGAWETAAAGAAGSAASHGAGPRSAEGEAPPGVDSDPVEQAVLSTSARQVAELRTLSSAMQRLHDAELASRDQEIAELRGELRTARRERDTVQASLQRLELAFARHVSELRGLGDDVSRWVEVAERERDASVAVIGVRRRRPPDKP